jgi:hypothetical protein
VNSFRLFDRDPGFVRDGGKRVAQFDKVDDPAGVRCLGIGYSRASRLLSLCKEFANRVSIPRRPIRRVSGAAQRTRYSQIPGARGVEAPI